MVEGIASASATFIDHYGPFFRTRTRDSAAVAVRYLRGLTQAEDCTFAAMATWLTRAARSSSSISSAIVSGGGNPRLSGAA
ncbi:MAG: hypothetical protein ABSC06_27695 [Rhodopila sp.]